MNPPTKSKPAAPSNLGRRTRRSSIATLGGYGLANVLRLGSNVLLAQMLIPEAFGLMQQVTVFLIALAMFSDVGAGPSIVHSRRGDDPAFLDTAFTIQALRGLALWVVSFLAAPYYARLYEQPQLAQFIPVAALTAVLAGFNSTRIYTAERNVAVARKVACELAAQTVAVAVMLTWAYFERSVWAFVAGGIAQSATVVVLSHSVLPGHPNRLRIERAALGEVLVFGRWIFLSTVLTFFAMQMDKLLLGRLEAIDAFGVYAVAFGLASMPQTIGGMLTGTVLYPVLAEHARHSRAQFALHFARARSLLLDASSFALIGVVLLAPPFFTTFYKPEYHAATWIAPLLVLPLWFTLLQITADRACLALGQPRVLALSNLASLILKATGSLVGFEIGGLFGFIVGLTAGTVGGHAVVQRALSNEGLSIVRQDLRSTTRLAAIVLPTALLPYALGGELTGGSALLAGNARTIFEVVLALAVLTPLGLRLRTQLTGLRRD